MRRLSIVLLLLLGVPLLGCAEDAGIDTEGSGESGGGNPVEDGGEADTSEGLSDASEGEVADAGKNLDTEESPESDTEGEETSEEDGNGGCSEGTPCDDEDPCTYGDQCADGVCSGTPYDCDDDLSCTEGSCLGDGGCQIDLKVDTCLIGGACYANGMTAPIGLCGVCDGGNDPNGWTWIDEAPCDDGNPCTSEEGACVDGLCESFAIACDDGDSCTQDSCGEEGCSHTFVYASCDDGNACTEQDVCLEGTGCTGVENLQCDDGNPCTTDSCDDGCVNTPQEGTCTDGNFCTWGDVCVDGGCVGGEPAVCEDGNSCTEGTCDPSKGCLYLVIENPCCTGSQNICDDGDACTYDLCEPESGDCINETFQGPCEDGNPCTQQDTCFNGLCLGFDKDCSDDNPCTLDACSPSGLCLHTPQEGLSCNDGVECTTGDVCTLAGTCEGDGSECQCSPDFSTLVTKISALEMGIAGNPGEGLDLDLDPLTCAPSTSCSDGIDNALSVLASFANETLIASVEDGDIIMLLEHVNFNANGEPFSTHFHLGQLVDSGCDLNASKCAYWAEASGFDEDCAPLVQIDDVVFENGQLSGGGKGTTLPISLPLSATAVLQLTLYDVQLSASGTYANGDLLIQGVIGGAVKETDLVAAIEALPEGSFPGGLSADVILSLLDSLLEQDIDINGDGVKEASSAGLKFIGIPGTLVGVAP